MPAAIPFLPLIASAVGVGGSLIGGAMNDRRQQQGIAAQQNIIQQLMAGITPGAYQEQARQATAAGQGQISADFASRGLLSSGAMYQASANAASKNYADAQAAYQRDRLAAYQTALGGQQGINTQVSQANPYDGVGAALGGLGTAAGSYFANQMAGQNTGSLPGFGTGGATSRYYAIPGYGNP